MSDHELVTADNSEDEPPHEPDDNEAANPEPRPDKRRGSQRRIPSRNDCLIGIAQLPGLVAARVLTPAQANSIRSQFEAILRHHAQAQHGQSPQLTDEQALRLLREQPELLELLEPLMTQEQIDLVMRGCRDDEHRQA